MRIALLAALVGCSSQAGIEAPDAPKEQGVRIEDSPGHYVERSTLTETNADGWTHVLVVDVPENEDEMQRAVRNEWIAPGKISGSLHTGTVGPFLEAGSGAVWTATRSWTIDDEKDFAVWVEANISADTLEGSGLLLDCADAGILWRWAYAHDHGLPAANTLAASGKLFGNWSMAKAWAKLPTDADWKKDQRFLAAYAYLKDQTYTHSLVSDLYPVELSRDWVMGGTIHLQMRDVSGHTETVKHVGTSGCGQDESNPCIETIWANEPAAETLYDTEIVAMTPATSGGFMRPRWPVQKNGVWSLVKAKSMPGYSLAQYDLSSLVDEEFQVAVYDHLGIILSALERARVEVRVLQSLLWQRTRVVVEGYLVCALGSCPESGSQYDNYSTPSRDARIRQTNAVLNERLKDVSASDIAQMRQSLRYPMLEGQSQTFENYVFNDGGVLDAMSSDPNADFFARWSITSPSDDATARSLAGVWIDEWATRDNLVRRAQKVCFSDGSDTPSCSHSAAAVTALDTSTIDTGLRALAAHITALPMSAAAHTEVAGTYAYCGGDCTLGQYLFDPTLLSNMKSKPWDLLSARYGF